jgi:UDP-N-acetyl-D-glucosamine dehydrogenase
VRRAAFQVRERLRSGQLVVLESTTYPGTTDELLLPVLEGRADKREPGQAVGFGNRAPEARVLQCGADFFLAFSPEREDPGNPSWGTTNTPKVVGGVDEISGDLAQALYDQVVDRTVRVSSARVAEAAKLMENIFRAVNIALVNELKIVFDRMGIDIWEVLDAAETKPFGFMRFDPGPGWGGHCIPIDPFYLAWKAREHGMTSKFIELAGEINTRMPGYVIEKLTLALNERGKAVKGSKILVLGLAYKPDIDDPRESPAFEIIDRLLGLGAEVSYHDPHIPVAPRMRSWPDLPVMQSEDLTRELLESSDGVVVVTDHTMTDYELIARHANLLIDTRGVARAFLCGSVSA